MSIGLYQCYPWHSEVMGVFIEMLTNENIDFVIYNDWYRKTPTNYVEYYKELFDFDSKIRKCSELISNIDSHRYVIFMSSVDIMDKKLINDNKEKLIFVNHGDSPLNPVANKHIIVSPLIENRLKQHKEFNTMKCKYILPTYKIDTEYKVKKENIFGIMGYFYHYIENVFYVQRDAEDLIRVLDKYRYANFKVHIFLRTPPKFIKKKHEELFKKLKEFDNVKIFWDLTTKELLEKVKECKFLLPLAAKNGCYHKLRLTGSIPLGLNNNVPIIVDSTLNNIYDLNSELVYNDSILEIIPELLTMNDKEYEEIIQNNMKYKNKIYVQNKENLISLLKESK